MKTLSSRFLPALRRIAPLAAAVALLAGVSAPASASAEDMVPLQTISHWKISADSAVCIALGSFQDGTQLGLGITAKGGAFISIWQPNWAIPASPYEVVSWVDRTPPVKFPAYAEGKVVSWQYPLDADHINLLSYGRTLYAQVGRQLYQYDLARSEAVLSALGRCAGERLAAANPFSDTQSNPYKPVVSNPFTGR